MPIVATNKPNLKTSSQWDRLIESVVWHSLAALKGERSLPSAALGFQLLPLYPNFSCLDLFLPQDHTRVFRICQTQR